MPEHNGRPLLSVRDLRVEFPTPSGWLRVVDGATFDVKPGEVVGLVGETGSGKTVTGLAVMGLIRAMGGRVEASALDLDGVDVLDLPEPGLRKLRGAQVAMVFQQAYRSLNPALTVGEQIAETIRCHEGIGQAAAWSRAVDMLDRVHIQQPGKRAHDYPHQLSGGMCQRVMIAMSLACGPKLLIADEPTTALDVTVQKRVIELLLELQEASDIAVLFVSHDLALIAEIADRVAVMYAGEVVEFRSAESVFTSPQHPYTQGLLDSIPHGRGSRLLAIPGTVPGPADFSSACRFAERCRHAQAGRCDAEHPALRPAREGGLVRCLRADELELGGLPQS